MKRVLCLIESLGSGGAERQITSLAVLLKEQGYDVQVCYYINDDFYAHYLEEHGVEHRYIADASDPKKRFFSLRRHVKAYMPDIVISYSSSPSMIFCLMKLLGAKFNLIVSERNTTQHICFRDRLRFALYRWANHIVPNSQSQGSFIQKNFSKLACKVRVITNFIDIEKFSPTEYQRTSDGMIRMVCVGRLMPQKNLLRFIEAIAQVAESNDELRIDWFGQDLHDSYSAECHKTIQELHLGERFIFHEPSSSIQEEYRKADVFCLPSLYEGFPNVLCEAMSCGKPVLCSKVCDNPHIVRDGENGFLFDPLSRDEMYETFRHFLDLPSERKVNMGLTSREIAVSMFSKDKFISSYSELIQ